MRHDEVERRYLAAVLGGASYAEFPVSPTDFASGANECIARAVQSLALRGEDVRVETVENELRSAGTLARAGGLTRLLEITNVIEFDAASAAKRVTTAAACRRLSDTLRLALETLGHDQLEVGQHQILAAAEEVRGLSQSAKSCTAFDAAADALEEQVTSAAKTDKRVTTGIRAVDDEIGHVAGGDLVIIAADTGVGKTSSALSIAHHLSATVGPSIYLSCEDTKTTLGTKLLSFRSGVDARQIRRGQLSRDNLHDIQAGLHKLKQVGLHLDFLIGQSDVAVCQSMTKLVRKHAAKAVFVDYVQTINPSEKCQSRKEEVRLIASRLKATAAVLGVPLFLLSQLARPPKDKEGSRFRIPTKHDLKEAGDLENMAELILVLWNGHRDAIVTTASGLRKPGKERDPSTVYGRIEKSKWGGDGAVFCLRRGTSGLLVESREG